MKIFKGWYGRAYTNNFIHVGNFSVFLNVFIPGGSDGKESVCNVRDPGSIPGSGWSPGEGNGNSLQYSCLENSMDWGAWWGHKNYDMAERLTLPLFILGIERVNFSLL